MVAMLQQVDLSGQPPLESWKVMIVDDDEAVHQVTQLVLGDFRFEDRPLEFIHAYSGREALETVQQHPDTALMLLDVVMETDQAGLELVRKIREQLRNHLVRIILRTGEPGQAPEEKVIVDYDINGYKEKTELTAQRLFTTVYSALRSYRDITIIERNKRGLEKVIESTAYIFGHENSRDFASAVLEQVASLLRMDHGVLYCQPIAGDDESVKFEVAAATGHYIKHLPGDLSQPLPEHMVELLNESYRSGKNLYQNSHCVLQFEDSAHRDSLMYIGQISHLSEWEQRLIELFCTNVSIALENVRLNSELQETQSEIVYMLADAVETRSQETGNHVKRVSKLAKMLAGYYGMDKKSAKLVELAAPLHDVGKIGIPDSILNKAGKHNAEEWETMKTHARIGHDLLRGSKRAVIQMAARICIDHHENWDGSGYPNGLKGEDISLEGRLVAVADVFDALGSKRCYKEPWEAEEIRNHMESQIGKKFEPKLVELLFENWEAALNLRAQYPD
jgi:response regulator RpfG family c-di-GMP phosphodiesterase